MNNKNLEGLPEKYFHVPVDDYDSDAHDYLIEQIEAISAVIHSLSGGADVTDKEKTIYRLSSTMESLLYQARAIMEAGEK